MKEVKPSKKPLLFYYGIVLLCVVLFNAFIAPMLMDDPVKEVDYGTFMRMVDNKEVDKVQVNTDEITFMDKEGKVYYTSAMEEYASLMGTDGVRAVLQRADGSVLLLGAEEARLFVP